MRRGKIFFYLAFILILGVVAVFVVWQRWMQPKAATPVQAAETPVVDLVNVVVISQKVPRGEVVQEQVLSTVPMPRDLVMEGMYINIKDVVGRQARFDLDSGIPLTSGMLVDQADQLSTTGSVAALSIPRGMVAVSVPINRLSSVSYAARPGDHVNVIVSMLMVDLDSDFQTKLPNEAALILAPGPTEPENGPTALTAWAKEEGSAGRAEVDPVLGQSLYILPNHTEEQGQRPRLASQTLLQDAVVLQVGEFRGETTTATVTQPDLNQNVALQATPDPNLPEDQPAPVVTEAPPEVITLIVTPQDAVTLNYLMYMHAGITLALRSSGDDSRVETEAVTLQFLLDQYNIPVPVKLPYGLEPGVFTLSMPDYPAPKPTPTPAPK